MTILQRMCSHDDPDRETRGPRPARIVKSRRLSTKGKEPAASQARKPEPEPSQLKTAGREHPRTPDREQPKTAGREHPRTPDPQGRTRTCRYRQVHRGAVLADEAQPEGPAVLVVHPAEGPDVHCRSHPGHAQQHALPQETRLRAHAPRHPGTRPGVCTGGEADSAYAHLCLVHSPESWRGSCELQSSLPGVWNLLSDRETGRGIKSG
ncbi:hypothetical protein diail_7266 [Diaporthe ilicicola]|nr:hypothetical protein diail_7266 [Diaporthe ilicicola]